MKTLTRILAATLTGAALSLSATAALADGRYYDDHGWKHKHHKHYYKHRGPAVVYAPYYTAPRGYYAPRAYYAPPPAYYGPPAVYEPGYYVPRPAPAVTIGISPIVIPLR
jgi:hypothetical protein